MNGSDCSKIGLSRRATCRSLIGQESSYFLGWQEYEKSPYDPIANPSGIIQMGLAENQVSLDLIEAWLEGHSTQPAPFRHLALFQDYHGLPAFKNALAELMSELRGNNVSFDPHKLVLTAGATSANETLAFCLANPGDAFLLPTPYYPGFDRDLQWRTGVKIIPIDCWSSDGFRLTKPAMEAASRRAAKLKIRVRGVLITNPSNPLGTTMTSAELDALADFIEERSLHLICDEVYSGTDFVTPSSFISVKQAISDRRPQLSNQVHIIYSLSKDLGLPGFRVGAIYSDNDLVISAATKMSSFGLVSSQTQHLLAVMLGDKEFVRGYVAENKRRLWRRHRRLVEGLREIGLECLESSAGLFCWVDMRCLMLHKGTFDGEMELWKKMVYEVGINITPGSSCHCTEPGWFRICFANMPEDTLYVALQRLRLFVKGSNRKLGWVRQLSALASEKRVQQLSR